MSQYYLMAQLPCLDAIIGTNMPLPISEERFYELCNNLCGKRISKRMRELTLLPSIDVKSTGNRLVDSWYKGERNLRFALAIVRAEKMQKVFEYKGEPLPVQFIETARMAAAMTDPMAAERFLNDFRLEFLESLRPLDGFSDAAVYHYALKLKLMTRMKKFDEIRGQEVYRNIYTSIMNGEGQEAE